MNITFTIYTSFYTEKLRKGKPCILGWSSTAYPWWGGCRIWHAWGIKIGYFQVFPKVNFNTFYFLSYFITFNAFWKFWKHDLESTGILPVLFFKTKWPNQEWSECSFEISEYISVYQFKSTTSQVFFECLGPSGLKHNVN